MKRSVTQAPVKEFFRRGLMFGGFGPVVLGIVYLILQHTPVDLALTGDEVFLGIVSTYLLAFIHAGSGVFHGIESWSPAKAALCQFGILYAAYVVCYVLNSWILFVPWVIGLFTVIFAAGYGAIYLTVYISVKAAAKRLNSTLE